MKDHLEEPSPARNALLARRVRELGLDPLRAPIVPAAGDVHPLSYAQQRLFFLDEIGGAEAYNMHIAVRCEGWLDRSVLQHALDGLLRRHSALRVCVEVADGRPAQRLTQAAPVAMLMTDLRAVAEDQREATLRARMASAAAETINLKTGPLLEARLFWLGPDVHVLMLLTHHIVSDRWSMEILVRDLAVLYLTATGAAVPLPPEPGIGYLDYCRWQRRWLTTELLAPRIEAWRRRLEGLESLELPFDNPSHERRFRGGYETALLVPESTEKLRNLAREYKATVAMVALAAFEQRLAIWSGASSVAVSMPVANRSRSEFERVVGMFVNTVIHYVSLSGVRALGDFLERVRDASLFAYEHQDVPFEHVVQAVAPRRAVGESPLAQVMFDFVERSLERIEIPGLSLAPLDLGRDSAKFDLTLVAEDGAAGLNLLLEYDADRFTAATARRLLDEIVWVLEEFARGGPQMRLPGLRPSDAAALATWNRTEAVYAGGWVHEQVLEHVALRPEATAACDDAGGRLSYRELGARSGALAAELGPGVERIAGVLLERTVDLPAALLGVLRAGWAYLPLDPEDPPQRLRELLEGAGAGVVLTERRLEDRLGGWIGRRLYVEEPRPPADPPPAALAGENLAYVLYTSGSTGKPKGVMVTHRGWRNYVSWCRRAYGLDETTTALVHSPLAFDLTVTSLWGPLAAGGMARLLCGGDLETVARALEVPTTLVKATPAHLEGLEALGSAAEVRTFVIGGEALSGRTAAHWRQRGEVINEYGPTETVVGCTIWRAPADFASDEVPIGRPIGNLRAYVLDEGLDPVGPGMAGELYIGGAGVCRGYLGRADLTAERFLPDPYGAAGERMYRTGDRARRRGDGELVYLGRLDDQVKIRGHRIEPGEVEAALLAEPGVRQAVVLALGEGGAKRLVAYVVGEGLSGPDLRERLRRRLPDWLTPSAVVTLAELPRTANGKIDRRALPTPTPEPSRVPAEGLERLLADLWEAVLERRGIGARDNFFELGGDSILSLQIVSRARQRGVRLTPRQVFEHQTIEALAQVALREEDAAPAGPEVGPAPLTPIQRWLTEQELGDPDHWNMAVMVRPREPIDAARLEAAVRQVTAHHGALRLRFDGSVQREAAEAREVFEAVAGAWDAAATQRSLRLSEGPVFKAVWLVEKGRLALVAHHLAVDGVSWRVILEDLEAAYEGRTLAPAAPSYVAWARRLTEQAATGEWRGELAYWRGQPWGEIGPLPVDGEGTNEEGTARTLRREWDEARTRALLEEGPTRWRAQIQETLLTALVRALCGWTGRGAALVAVEGHGRTGIEDLEPTRTVGWFTALYPLVLRGGGSAGEALAEVRARLRGVPGGGQGWGALRYLDAESGLEGFAEPEVSFNYLGRIGGEPGALFTFADEATGPWRAASARRRFLIDFNAVVVDRRLQVHWTYSPARHNPDTIERLAKSFEDEMAGLMDASGSAAESYPLTPVQEGILFHTQLEPSAYVVQLAVELESEFDRVRFASAWNAIVARHDALRTRFSWRDGEPLQWVEPMAELPLVWLDWSDDPAGRLEEHLREDRRRGFALDRAPLARVAVGRAGPGRHWLVLSFHHLILDGWSLAIVLSQWLRLYEDAGAALAPVRPFADYLRWLDRRDDDEAFWRREFGDLTEPTRLWLEGAAGERGPAEQRLALSEEATARLQAAAQRAQVTLATLIHTAWAKVLARLGGGREVIFGVTLSGRPADLPGVEGMVGLFINTLPLRVSADASLAQVQRKRLELEARQHTALTRVQRLSGLGGQPLFDTIVVVENYPVDRALLEARGGLRVGAVRGVEQTHYQVTLVATPGARLGLGIGHERGRLSEAAAKRLLEELAWTLDELGHGRDATGLRPSDAAALATWNRTEAVYAGGWVHEQVLEHVALRPEATAACDDAGGRLSYRELGARSGALAAELGPGVERIAGVLLERTVDLPAALLGVLRAGWAYLPLDPEDPPQRLRELLEGAGAGVVLTERRLEDRLGGWIGRRLYVEEPRPPADPPPAALAGENLAYVLYTSGSTGKPKGVMVGHAALANRLRWMQEALPIDGADIVLQKTPISFDVSLWELLWPLTVGSRLHLLRPGGHRDAGYLARRISEVGVTTMHFVPSMLAAFLDEPDLVGCRALKYVVASGEALQPTLVARFHARLDAELYNLYGPTEAAIDVTWWRCHRGEAETPIGRPIANVQMHILDDALRPVPIGAEGELYISGRGLARGYLHRADLTAERFLPDPLGGPGGRMYRTGDRASRRPDGAIMYLGRNDGQVKIRGVRVELAEVEAALLQQPGVSACVAIAEPEPTGGLRLVAYVVADESCGDLRSFARERLPEVMRPAAVARLPALPLTRSGKVDRAALPPVVTTPREEKPLHTASERAIGSVFAAVLGLEEMAIRADDDFFQIGGHSIAATRTVSRLRSLGYEVKLADLFADPTAERLAARLEGSLIRPISAIPLALRDRPLRLSPAQERLWFLEQLAPGDPAYHVAAAVEIEGAIDVARLTRSFADVLRRHEIWRTRYAVADDGELMQIVEQEPPFELRCEPSPCASIEGLLAVAADESRRPFDLLASAPLRARLFAMSGRRHVLVLAMHHILVDAWSLGVLLDDIAAFYDGSPPPPLPLQFADYAAWHRDYTAAGLEDWKRALLPLPPVLEAPAARARSSGYRPGSGFAWRFDLAATEQLEAFASSCSVTLFSVLLTAFAGVLSRDTGERDFIIGVPVAGRERPELERLLGVFINTLPIRLDFHGRPTVREALQRTGEAVAAALVRQDVPLESIVQGLGLSGASALFQALFDFHNVPTSRRVPGELKLRTHFVDRGAAQFDLALTLERAADGLRGRFEFAIDAFEDETIRAFGDRFSAMLGQFLAAASDGLIGDLSLLNDAERGRWLEDCGCVCDYPRGHVVELFGEQARRTPDAIAVRGAGETVSYGELDRRSDRLAQALRRRGVERERIVALVGERGIGFVTAMLAVWKAGGAYLPILPDEPRRAEMLDSAHLVLAWGEAVASWRDCGVAVVDRAALERESGIDAALGRSGEGALAYVLYTSGSTGRPKGALIEQRGMVNHLYAKIEALGLTSRDVVAQSATQTFDISVWQCLAALLAGGQVAVIGEEEARDPARLWRAVARDGVTVLETVPLMLEALLGCEGPAGGLKWMIPTGEALAPELCRRWLQRHPEIPVMNAYGPTECSDDVTHHVARTAPEAGLLQMPIGRPIGNLRAYVLDEGLDPVGPGMAGELYIGGAGVCRGYLGRADLTAERFLPDPYGAAGERMYRTGDRARRRGDGELVYLGRLDDQVKIRGHRIEPGEVEAALLAEPGVRQAVVLALGEGGAKRLVAYVVGEGLSGPDLRERLRRRLPDWLTPSAVVTLAELPRTANGKIDRRALPTPTPEPSRAPLGILPTQELLISIWRDLLHCDVAPDDDFFALGGHSLLALQLLARVREVFSVQTSVRKFFEAPTVAGLAETLAVAVRGDHSAVIARGMPGEDAPMTLAQLELWTVAQAIDEPGAFVIPMVVRLRGPLGAEALSAAFDDVLCRHEPLRSALLFESGEPVIRLVEAGPFELAFDDLAALAPAQREAAVREIAERETRRPFSLERPPFVRARLMRLGNDDHALALTLHHIAADGWSIAVLVRDLGEAYQARLAGRRPELPELPFSFSDFARWQRDSLLGDDWGGQLAYWLDRLAGPLRPLELPLDHPRADAGDLRVGACKLTLSAEMSDALRALARRERCTLFMTLLTAFSRLLYELTGESDQRIGAMVANREHPGADQLVGMLINVIVMRVCVDEGLSFIELMRRVRGVALEGYARQEVPFGLLARVLQRVRGVRREQIFRVMCVLQDAPPPLDLGGVRIVPFHEGPEDWDPALTPNSFDLVLMASDESDGIRLHLKYRPGLFKRATITRLLERLAALLGQAAAAPVAPDRELANRGAS